MSSAKLDGSYYHKQRRKRLCHKRKRKQSGMDAAYTRMKSTKPAAGAYVIGLKENQCTLYHDVALYFRDIPAEIPTFETLEKDRGRLEKRTFYLLTERAWEYEWGKWANLNGIGMVKTHVWEKDTVRENTRYFITSLTDVTEFAYAVSRFGRLKTSFTAILP